MRGERKRGTQGKEREGWMEAGGAGERSGGL